MRRPVVQFFPWVIPWEVSWEVLQGNVKVLEGGL